MPHGHMRSEQEPVREYGGWQPEPLYMPVDEPAPSARRDRAPAGRDPEPEETPVIVIDIA